MLAINTLLQNRYRIVREIGRGGMGAVYEARHEQLNNIVAVKQILAPDDLSRKALKHEAQLLANLRHPALPRVIDHFTEGDSQFMVMEFIPGKDLAELLRNRREPFPCAQVVDWGIQLLTILEYLHTHEPPIVHRDIKPNNLKLTARGEIILLDFGLSKGLAFTSRLSLKGYSLNYAPPEQVQGQGTDPRSDLYSVGATLYHLLTNTLPPNALVRSANIPDALASHLQWANEINPKVPREVAAILQSAMAVNREQRPVSAAVMREVLQNVMGLSSGQMKRSMPPEYPATPASVPKTGELKRRNTKSLSARPPQIETNGLGGEPQHQSCPPGIQTSQGNVGSQSVETGVSFPPFITAQKTDQTMPEAKLLDYSGAQNTLPVLPEKKSREKAGIRLWFIGGAVVMTILAAFFLIYFFIMNDRKPASTTDGTHTISSADAAQPVSTEGATATTPAPPVTNSDTSSAPVAKDTHTPPAPAATNSAPAETREKAKRGVKASSPIPRGNASPADSTKDAGTAPTPAASDPAPAVEAPKDEKEEKPALTAGKEERPDPPKSEPEKSPSGEIIRSKIISGNATHRVEPLYPPAAKAARITGMVVVEVTVNERGKVIAAKAVSGPQMLKDAAVTAARRWKFTPTQLNGQPVRVTSLIRFNFQL